MRSGALRYSVPAFTESVTTGQGERPVALLQPDGVSQ